MKEGKSAGSWSGQYRIKIITQYFQEIPEKIYDTKTDKENLQNLICTKKYEIIV